MEKAKKRVVGDPMEAGVDDGPIVSGNIGFMNLHLKERFKRMQEKMGIPKAFF